MGFREWQLFKVFFGFFYGRSVFVIVICGEYFSTQPVFFGSSFMFISCRYFIYLSKKYNWDFVVIQIEESCCHFLFNLSICQIEEHFI